MAAEITIMNVVAIFTDQAHPDRNSNRTRHISVVSREGDVLKLVLFPLLIQPLPILDVHNDSYSPAETEAAKLARQLQTKNITPLRAAHAATEHIAALLAHDCSNSQQAECGSTKEETIDEGMC